MWALENRTPFAAERTWVRDRDGAEVWIVAVKGTFAIDPAGSTEPAEPQVEVCRAPVYRGEPGRSSLLYESDLIHTKPTTDVLLNGHAYAPPSRPARQVDVLMKVGPIEKRLRVVGDRTWERGLLGPGMSDPTTFAKMAITYERAYGGTDQKSTNPKKHGWERRNPVGMGFAVDSENLVGRKVPNVQDPNASTLFGTRRSKPAGFGPIARDWSPRVELAGTYDAKWEAERLPLPPEDFDERFHQCAPEDQRPPRYLKGGEPVELQNLTPDGSLRFDLPRVTLGFETHFTDGAVIHHHPTLHTVILEPDVPRVLMVWHAHLPCHPRVYKLRQTIVRQKRRLPPVGGRRASVGVGVS